MGNFLRADTRDTGRKGDAGARALRFQHTFYIVDFELKLKFPSTYPEHILRHSRCRRRRCTCCCNCRNRHNRHNHHNLVPQKYLKKYAEKHIKDTLKIP